MITTYRMVISKMKEITKNQYYQLLGLCLASIKLENQKNALCDAWEEIVGKENRDRFWDFGDESDLSELEKKLGYDKIKVKKK